MNIFKWKYIERMAMAKERHKSSLFPNFWSAVQSRTLANYFHC